MRDRFVRYGMGIVAIGLLVGCTPVASPDELLRSPKMKEDEQLIREAVLANLPPGSTMMIPRKKQEDGGPIIEKDINGDNSNEIITLYRYNESDYVHGLLILEKQQSGYKKIAEIEGAGKDIDFLSFQDVSGDGKQEVFLGFISEDELSKELFGYRWTNGSLQPIMQSTYQEAVAGDLEQDGKSEVYLFQHDRENYTAKVEVYEFEGQGMKRTEELPLDGAFNGYEKAVLGKVAPTSEGIYVDVGMGAHSAETLLFTNVKGKLTQLKFGEEANNLLFKPYQVYSEDINDDGILEVGTMIAPVGTGDLSMVDTPWVTQWHQWDGYHTFTKTNEMYFDYQHGFRFDIPDKWKDNYTISYVTDRQQGSMIFYYVNDDGKKEGELFRLMVMKREEWEREEAKRMISPTASKKMAGGGSQVVIALLPEESALVDKQSRYQELMLTLDEIAKAFRRIS
ncbi:hypothetical protein [Brevibacillus daliensis]|uniref:hypothetical protein n=1 Tax=Brevibacillus daliensis TaxID=2892995 RepID=UPI001E42E6FC|nr:hypothetical protein [Brevibacillus daliensis]